MISRLKAFGILWILTVWPDISYGDEAESIKRLEQNIEEFLKQNDYYGAVLGVKFGDKLSYLKSFGKTEYGDELTSTDQFPVSSLSKSLTAVAIMKLVEEGKLNMSTPVFGSSGVLWMIKPVKNADIDTLLYDITVRHLLHHTAGWNQNKPPLYDPMMNRLYMFRGHNVTDLISEMDIRGNLLPYHMIRYVISKPLHFTPGTEYHYFNLGYSILGRIIEEVAGTSYEAYVKDNILVPAGMWQTRIGPHKKRNKKLGNAMQKLDLENGEVTVGNQRQLDIEDVVHPQIIDSTLGWYSTASDVMRFISSIDGSASYQILKAESVKMMLAIPPEPMPQHRDKWTAAGFLAKNDGSFWQVADDHYDDFLVYHDGLNRVFSNYVVKDFSQAHKRRGLSFALLFAGNRHKHLKHAVKKIIKDTPTWPKDNKFAEDLTDLNVKLDSKDSITKFKLPEPHLSTYDNAMKNQGYAPNWISSYNFEGNTNFVTIYAKTLMDGANVTKNNENYVLLHGLTKQKLRKYMHRYWKYHVAFIHTYRSSSHDDTIRFVAVLKKGEAKTKVGIGKTLDFYSDHMNKIYRKKYTPIVQSMEMHGDKEHVTYIVKKSKKTKYKSYYDLSLEELETKIRHNGLADRNLIYLDTYGVHGKVKFSAVFNLENANQWILLNRLTADRICIDAKSLEASGHVPEIIVGYQDEKGQLEFSSLWRRY